MRGEATVWPWLQRRKDGHRLIIFARKHSMKKPRGLLKFFKTLRVQTHVENGLVQNPVQNCKVARFRRGSQACQDEVSSPELKLLGNLHKPWILEQLR